LGYCFVETGIAGRARGAALQFGSIYIDAVRTGIDPFQQFAGFLDEWEFAACGMIMLEVCRGLREPVQLQRFRERFAVMIYFSASNTIWERATQLGWSLDRQGRVIPATDLLIAATALQTGAAVLTRDARFRMIPGLEVLERLA
jgi:predicted nucleic acid-binding protein